MIQLHPDYLLFETSHGQIIPCSAELVAVELIGQGAESIDPELVRQAAAAVMHYFKQDLGMNTVTVGEFSRMLEQALRSLKAYPDQSPNVQRTSGFDLKSLASTAGESFELSFYPQLRQHLKSQLDKGEEILRFHDLRACVKLLLGAKRWGRRCQGMNDQIVEYLRACLESESSSQSCRLVIY